jgi:hypothetical protein
MTEYNAHYRTDAEYALYHFEADSPEHALQLARELYDHNHCALQFDNYEGPLPLDEIEISGDEGDQLAVWQSDDMRLRLAARQLLEALEAARVALNKVPRFKVPSLGSDSYKIAALCDAALAEAKPLAS